MSLNEIFAADRRVIARGGVVPTNAGPCRGWFSDLAERVLDLFKVLSNGVLAIPQPHVDFVASRRVSAFAFAASNSRFIALHTGIVEMFWTYNLLLSTPNVLRRIGNARLERAHDVVNLRDIPTNPKSTIRKPFDPVRAEFAEQLSMICFDFLAAHEIAHILHGHLEFLAAHSPIDSLTHHALELDADYFAVNIILNEIFGFVKQRRTLPELLAEIYSTERDALFVGVFALCVLYRLQWLHDTTFWNIQNPEKSHPTHPPMPIRTMSLLACISARIQHDNQLIHLPRRFRTVTTMGGIHAELGLQRIRGAPLKVPDGFWAIGSPPTLEYVERVNKRWTEIRPELQTLSHLPLPEVG